MIHPEFGNCGDIFQEEIIVPVSHPFKPESLAERLRPIRGGADDIISDPLLSPDDDRFRPVGIIDTIDPSAFEAVIKRVREENMRRTFTTEQPKWD